MVKQIRQYFGIELLSDAEVCRRQQQAQQLNGRIFSCPSIPRSRCPEQKLTRVALIATLIICPIIYAVWAVKTTPPDSSVLILFVIGASITALSLRLNRYFYLRSLHRECDAVLTSLDEDRYWTAVLIERLSLAPGAVPPEMMAFLYHRAETHDQFMF